MKNIDQFKNNYSFLELLLTPLDLGLLFSPLAEMEAEAVAASSASARCGGKLKAEIPPFVLGTLGEDGFDPYPITARDG